MKTYFSFLLAFFIFNTITVKSPRTPCGQKFLAGIDPLAVIMGVMLAGP